MSAAAAVIPKPDPSPVAKVRPGVIYGMGALLLIVNAYFGTFAYVVVQAILWTQTSLQRGPIVMLTLLVLFNLSVGRVARRRFALSRQELLILYSMLCMGTCVGGYGFVQQMINQLVAPTYYASPGNHFTERILPNLPTWLAPRDPAVINGFYRGNTTFYTAQNLGGWVIPILAWSAFIVAIFWVLFCATALLRKSWVEEERLTFPLVLLPLEMTDTAFGEGDDGRVPFWKNRWMWAGFVIAGLLESGNFINFLYPAFPSLPIKPSMGPNHLEQFLTSRPWNAVGTLTLAFYPAVIGIGYLLSLDVSFSCWFLYLLGKAANVFCSAVGLSDAGAGGTANRAPFLREQGIGAFVGVALFSAYLARRQLAAAWRSLERPTSDDANELMSYPTALIGGGIGMLFLVAFLVAAGLAPIVACLFVLTYLLVAITLARIVSEAGAGWAWAPNWSPAAFTGDAIGVTNLSAREITVLIGYLVVDQRYARQPASANDGGHETRPGRLCQSPRLPKAFDLRDGFRGLARLLGAPGHLLHLWFRDRQSPTRDQRHERDRRGARRRVTHLDAHQARCPRPPRRPHRHGESRSPSSSCAPAFRGGRSTPSATPSPRRRAWSTCGARS